MDSEVTGDYFIIDISHQGNENVYNSDYITDAIVILIPQVSKLYGVYQAWYPLKEEERKALDNKAINNFTHDYLTMYKILIDALHRWDEIQDSQGGDVLPSGTNVTVLSLRGCRVEGAPGAKQGLVVFGYHLEKQLLAIVNRIESFLESLERSRPQGEGLGSTPRTSRGKRSRARGKQAQLRSAESLADLLSGSDLPEPLSD